jgi:hypothetical protein
LTFPAPAAPATLIAEIAVKKSSPCWTRPFATSKSRAVPATPATVPVTVRTPAVIPDPNVTIRVRPAEFGWTTPATAPFAKAVDGRTFAEPTTSGGAR